MSPDVTVSIPARPRYVQIFRTVIAGVAARLDFPYDAIEDLKIVVDEACAQLLPLRPSAITLGVTSTDTGLEMTVSADAETPEWPPPDAQRGLAWQVMSALTDRATWERADGSPALRLTKTVGASA